jgi:hypothetical protein
MSSSDIQSTFIETPAAASATALSTAAAVGNNAPLTLVSSHNNALSTPRKIVLTSAGDSSGISFTVVGLDQDGNAATESITGADTSTSTSTGYWSSITSITAVGNPTGDQSAGTTSDCAGLIFGGDLRMRGMYVVNTGTAGTVNFVQGSPAGTSRLKFNTVAAANSTEYPDIPEDGVVFRNGGYILFDQAKLSSITVFYA